jgi:ABC-type Na+ efflux pump permease subunit
VQHGCLLGPAGRAKQGAGCPGERRRARPYFLTIFALTAINDTLAQILSFFPLFSPMLMLARAGVGQVSPLETTLAIALLLAATFRAAWLAARLYRYGVL